MLLLLFLLLYICSLSFSATQFSNLKWGDRFFFTHDNEANHLTNDEYKSVRQRR